MNIEYRILNVERRFLQVLACERVTFDRPKDIEASNCSVVCFEISGQYPEKQSSLKKISSLWNEIKNPVIYSSGTKMVRNTYIFISQFWKRILFRKNHY